MSFFVHHQTRMVDLCSIVLWLVRHYILMSSFQILSTISCARIKQYRSYFHLNFYTMKVLTILSFQTFQLAQLPTTTTSLVISDFVPCCFVLFYFPKLIWIYFLWWPSNNLFPIEKGSSMARHLILILTTLVEEKTEIRELVPDWSCNKFFFLIYFFIIFIDFSGSKAPKNSGR